MIGIPNHHTGQSTAHIAHGKAHDKLFSKSLDSRHGKEQRQKHVLRWLLLVLSSIVVVVVVVVVVAVEIVVVPVGLCSFHG